jgi:cytochrome c biogenesis protein CcmG/thiol:disulfide interchange protein DsbE
VPEFELELLAGEGTLSSEELKGMLVVVNFWASWCEPCRKEVPELNRVWERYRDDDVIVLGVNVQDTEDNARLFAERFEISYPLVRDPGQEFASGLGVYGLPQTFFVDEEWKLFGVGAGEEIDQAGQRTTVRRETTILGAVSEEDLVEQIEAMIEARDG